MSDSLGAGIGIFCAARVLGKKAQIVINEPTTSIRPLMECFTPEKGYPEDMFINSEIAIEEVSRNSLVMVVDTNRPSYTECPELLTRTDTIVVFDHHRQGSEVIENPLLSYIEPYASSACEMVAEVLQYFQEGFKLSPAEADCIYAGILIDTNNFMTKTGVRTFEAAAYLRRSGAEVTRVRKMLRNDMACYKARAEAVRHAEVYRGAFAISVCPSEDVESPDHRRRQAVTHGNHSILQIAAGGCVVHKTSQLCVNAVVHPPDGFTDFRKCRRGVVCNFVFPDNTAADFIQKGRKRLDL